MIPLAARTPHPSPLRLLAGVVALACPVGVAAQSAVPTPAEWREDIDALRTRLPAAHLDLFHLLPRARFHAELDALAAMADTASPERLLTGIARVVAAVGEGHTNARLLRPDMHAFPMLTQVQDDGLRIRRIERGSARLLGARVRRVEGHPVEEVLQRLSPVISADNAMGVRAWQPYYLATREVLAALGLLDDRPGLDLDVERLDGVAERLLIEAGPLPQVEMLLLGDSPEMVETGDGSPPGVRDAGAGPYWFEWLPERNAIFVRIDRLVSDPQRPFAAFVDSLFAAVDRRSPERLVLDLRTASGGNHISLPLVHGLLRREAFTRRGRLFVLIGRGTFSAGQNLTTLLDRHVEPIFVGEPTGGRPNAWGVVGRFTLPNSGLEIRYSRHFVQDADPADYRHWQEPHLYVPPDVQAELEGVDPALEAALSFVGDFPWTESLRAVEVAHAEGGLEAALSAARTRMKELRGGRWLVERELNRVGYELLRAGRVEEALTVFRFNLELFPEAWNAWDSLGEALAAAGRTTEAIAAYRRSVAFNGYNENGRRQLRLLALEGAAEGGSLP